MKGNDPKKDLEALPSKLGRSAVFDPDNICSEPQELLLLSRWP